jgi:hypothetical protein
MRTPWVHACKDAFRVGHVYWICCTLLVLKPLLHICNASPLIVLPWLSHQEKGASIQEDKPMGHKSQNPKTDQFSYKGNCNLELTVGHLSILFQTWYGGLHEVH